MGYYLNPKGMEKEQWLLANAEPIGAAPPPRYEDDEGRTVACLVDNGWMTACGLAYSQHELESFADPRDNRPKRYFWIKPEHKEMFQ